MSHDSEINKRNRRVAIEIRIIDPGREKGLPQKPQIGKVSNAVLIEVRITGVPKPVSIRVLLKLIDNDETIVLGIRHCVGVSINIAGCTRGRRALDIVNCRVSIKFASETKTDMSCVCISRYLNGLNDPATGYSFFGVKHRVTVNARWIGILSTKQDFKHHCEVYTGFNHIFSGSDATFQPGDTLRFGASVDRYFYRSFVADYITQFGALLWLVDGEPQMDGPPLGVLTPWFAPVLMSSSITRVRYWTSDTDTAQLLATVWYQGPRLWSMVSFTDADTTIYASIATTQTDSLVPLSELNDEQVVLGQESPIAAVPPGHELFESGATFGGSFTLFNRLQDFDRDGRDDAIDNCTDVPNSGQLDGDGDGFGNLCDADLDGNCVTDAGDLGQLRDRFFSNDPVADLDGDGIVNFRDLGIMRNLFFQSPGPSGQTSCPQYLRWLEGQRPY